MFEKTLPNFVKGIAELSTKAAFRGLEEAFPESSRDLREGTGHGSISGHPFIEMSKIPPEERSKLEQNMQQLVHIVLEQTTLGGLAITESLMDSLNYLQKLSANYHQSERIHMQETLKSKYDLPNAAAILLVDMFELGRKHNAIIPSSKDTGSERTNCMFSCGVTTS